MTLDLSTTTLEAKRKWSNNIKILRKQEAKILTFGKNALI